MSKSVNAPSYDPVGFRALEALSPEDITLIGRAARRLASLLPGRDENAWRDLWHESWLRIANGTRTLPDEIPTVAVVIMTMKSILSERLRKSYRETPEEIDEGRKQIWERPSELTPLETHVKQQSVFAFLETFADPMERRIVEGMMKGLEGGELESWVGYQDPRVKFASVVRRVKREIERRYPGWDQ
ncbi:MAG: hypothetical protein WDN76_04760 [Alphaproteobacteria bacterium]